MFNKINECPMVFLKTKAECTIRTLALLYSK